MKKLLLIILTVAVSLVTRAQATIDTSAVKKHNTTNHVRKHKKKRSVHSMHNMKSDTATVSVKDRGLSKGSAQGRRMKSTHRNSDTKNNHVIQTPDGPIKTGGYKTVRGSEGHINVQDTGVDRTDEGTKTPPIYVPKKQKAVEAESFRKNKTAASRKQ